jgi:hypothetical protein
LPLGLRALELAALLECIDMQTGRSPELSTFLKLRKASELIFCVAEKSHEKIPSQYERHERQHNQ